jgi:hypothetical protein
MYPFSRSLNITQPWMPSDYVCSGTPPGSACLPISWEIKTAGHAILQTVRNFPFLPLQSTTGPSSHQRRGPSPQYLQKKVLLNPVPKNLSCRRLPVLPERAFLTGKTTDGHRCSWLLVSPSYWEVSLVLSSCDTGGNVERTVGQCLQIIIKNRTSFFLTAKKDFFLFYRKYADYFLIFPLGHYDSTLEVSRGGKKL